MEKLATSVLLNMFINENEKCHCNIPCTSRLFVRKGVRILVVTIVSLGVNLKTRSSSYKLFGY